MSEKKERKTYLRLPLESEMMVRYGHQGQVFFGSCQKLSAGGLFVATKNPAPHGSTITMRFTLPGHNHPLVAKGKVVKVNRSVKGGNSQSGMHVLFTQMSPRDEQELKRFLVPRLRQMVIKQLIAQRKKKS